MYFMLLINKNKLCPDLKKNNKKTGKMTGVKPTSYFTVIGNTLGLTLYTGNSVVFYCLKSLYWPQINKSSIPQMKTVYKGLNVFYQQAVTDRIMQKLQ